MLSILQDSQDISGFDFLFQIVFLLCVFEKLITGNGESPVKISYQNTEVTLKVSRRAAIEGGLKNYNHDMCKQSDLIVNIFE